MEHYITSVKAKNVIGLSDLVIRLRDDSRQHLILTGKNGSGKTTLLNAMVTYLQSINDGCFGRLAEFQMSDPPIVFTEEQYQLAYQYLVGTTVGFNDGNDLDGLYKEGKFITAWYSANRSLSLAVARGVQDVALEAAYPLLSSPARRLVQYLVHLRTQQAYAKNEGDAETERLLQEWFDRFEGAIRVLLGDPSARLAYDFKRYAFQISQEGKSPYDLDKLSDGYSSVLYILSDLMMRMDHNWLRDGILSSYDAEGVVLIDELETHLHIELQKTILPFLTTFFPRLQFVISTHSPYILTSISNAKVYDLERRLAVEDLSAYSADEVAEGYFSAEEYSDEIVSKLDRYEKLVQVQDPTPDEAAERAKLRLELRSIPEFLGSEARSKFEDIKRETAQ